MVNFSPKISDIFKFKSLLCPKCKVHKINKGFLTIYEKCPKCGLMHKNYKEGWVGPAMFNYTITVLFIGLTFAYIQIFLNKLALEYQLVIAISVGVLVNLFFYRYAYALWIYILYFVKFKQQDI